MLSGDQSATCQPPPVSSSDAAVALRVPGADDVDVDVVAGAPGRAVRDPAAVVGPPRARVARLAVGQQRHAAVGEVVPVDLEELVAADVLRKDERVARFRLELRPRPRARERTSSASGRLPESGRGGPGSYCRSGSRSASPGGSDASSRSSADRNSVYRQTSSASPAGTAGTPSTTRFSPGLIVGGSAAGGVWPRAAEEPRSAAANKPAAKRHEVLPSKTQRSSSGRATRRQGNFVDPASCLRGLSVASAARSPVAERHEHRPHGMTVVEVPALVVRAGAVPEHEIRRRGPRR